MSNIAIVDLTTICNVGNAGDHNVATIDVTVPQALVDLSPDYYMIHFLTSSWLSRSTETLTAVVGDDGSVISTPLWDEITVAGPLLARIGAYDMDGNELVKAGYSAVFTMIIGDGIPDGIEGDPTAHGLLAQLLSLLAAFPADITIGTVTEGTAWSFTLVDGKLNIVYIPADSVIVRNTVDDLPSAENAADGLIGIVLNGTQNPHFEQSILEPSTEYSSFYIKEAVSKPPVDDATKAVELNMDNKKFATLGYGYSAEWGGTFNFSLLVTEPVLLEKVFIYVWELNSTLTELGFGLGWNEQVAPEQYAPVSYSLIPMIDAIVGENWTIDNWDDSADKDAIAEYLNTQVSLTSYAADVDIYTTRNGSWVKYQSKADETIVCDSYEQLLAQVGKFGVIVGSEVENGTIDYGVLCTDVTVKNPIVFPDTIEGIYVAEYAGNTATGIVALMDAGQDLPFFAWLRTAISTMYFYPKVTISNYSNENIYLPSQFTFVQNEAKTNWYKWTIVDGGGTPELITVNDIVPITDEITFTRNSGSEGDIAFNNIFTATTIIPPRAFYYSGGWKEIMFGRNGLDGPATAISIGTVSVGAAWSFEVVENKLNITYVPAVNGDSPTFSIGTVVEGATASAEVVEVGENSYAINLVLPKGADATLTMGTVTAGQTWGASITNGVLSITYAPSTFLTPLLALPQNLTLVTNTDYTGTMSQSGTFVLPSSQDLNQNVANVINVDLIVSGSISISWGTTLFANTSIPVVPEGSYNLQFVWSVANQKWGVILQPMGVVA